MLTKLKGILVQVIAYKENSFILKIYTESSGLQSFIVSGVKGSKSAIRPAHLQLLNLLELEVYQKQNVSIHRVKELKCNPPLGSIHSNIEKISVSLFMAEVLSKTLNEENQADNSLFEFLFNLIQYLDISDNSLAWIPQHFLIRLSAHLGFYPYHLENLQDPVFSLKEGVFIDYLRAGPDALSKEDSKILSTLMKTGISNLHLIPANRHLRNHLLESLLRYYSYHIPGFREIQSHTVLSALW